MKEWGVVMKEWGIMKNVWGIIVKEEGVMLNNVVCGAWNRAENVS